MIATDSQKFVSAYPIYFGNIRSKQADALTVILNSFNQDAELDDVRHAAYMLATIWHETAQTFEPITEYGGYSYFSRYDGRCGNSRRGDGYRYRGRGYVQLTFKCNYKKASEKLCRLTNRYPEGIDLVANPDLALEPEVASDILLLGMREGWFTGKKLNDYITGTRCDYYRARKIINALDKARTIARAADKFETLLNAAKVGSVSSYVRNSLW